jgi:TRAP-type C4-dicarboxylate transport system permease small subunit
MKTLYKWYCRIEEIFCGISFSCIVVLVFTSAIARTANKPLAWSIDISQLLLAWTAFFGADCAFRSNQLMGIDLFTRKLTPALRKTAELTVLFLMLGTLFILIGFGIKLSIDSYKRAFQTLTLSYSFVTMSLPMASISMSISVLLKIKKRLFVSFKTAE